MRISSKARYASIALMDIATQEGNLPVTLSDISKRQDISVSYLEQIFAKLRRSGLVTASRGPGGGYKLSKPADQITMADIADIFDKETVTPENTQGNVAMTGWLNFSIDLRQFLGNATLAKYVEMSSLAGEEPSQTDSITTAA